MESEINNFASRQCMHGVYTSSEPPDQDARPSACIQSHDMMKVTPGKTVLIVYRQDPCKEGCAWSYINIGKSILSIQYMHVLFYLLNVRVRAAACSTHQTRIWHADVPGWNQVSTCHIRAAGAKRWQGQAHKIA